MGGARAGVRQAGSGPSHHRSGRGQGVRGEAPRAAIPGFGANKVSNRHTTGRLVIFISSTADLQKARDVVEKTLLDLEIDGSRFESWSASPNPPIAECLQGIEESDGLILILGSRYGSIDKDSGLSITHLEYLRAKDLKRPIWGYILEAPEREAAQARFIEEVKIDLFSPRETSIEELGKEVKASLFQEFTRCFRKVHSYPPESPRPQIFHGTTGYQLPFDPKKALPSLQNSIRAMMIRPSIRWPPIAKQGSARFPKL